MEEERLQRVVLRQQAEVVHRVVQVLAQLRLAVGRALRAAVELRVAPVALRLLRLLTDLQHRVLRLLAAAPPLVLDRWLVKFRQQLYPLVLVLR